MFYKNLKDITLPTMKGRVAVKLHMGDTGSLKTRLSPEDVSIIVNKLREGGTKPFLFDTTTLYRRARYTEEGYANFAREHGFDGFDVIIGSDNECKDIGGYGVPKALLAADGMLVLSHAKGHSFTGFGGALKNIGMGCVNKEGKRKIHMLSKPVYDESKCRQCGICVDACEDHLIEIRGKKIVIDMKDCSGCGECCKACPTGALFQKEGSVEESFDRFNGAAKAIVSEFMEKGRPVFCVNVLKNITERCDCSENPGRIVCPDIGCVTGENPLKVDLETVELIKKKSPSALDWKTWNLFVKKAENYFG